MKYKILLTGTHQPLINDFFNHMDFSFECLSSSIRTDDIMAHLKYYEPHVLIYCLNKESNDDIRSFRKIFQQLSVKQIPLIIIGEQENCSEFSKTFPITDYLTILRPFSTKGLEDKIVSYLETHYANTKAKNTKEENDEKDELEKTLAFVDKMAAELEKKESETPKPAEPERKKHILIVDDDSRVLKLVKSILIDRYNVATAVSGKVAMKFLENKETDLILLDYEMPGESGAEILQKIRSNEKLQKLPVIFLTGVTDKERIQEVLTLSPQGYLLKPIDKERLNNTLQEVFRKSN